MNNMVRTIIIFIVILGAAGIVYSLTMQHKTSSLTPQTKKVSAPSPTPNSTNNLKTYKNLQQSYTIKIPLDWKITENEQTGNATFTATDNIASMTVTVLENAPQNTTMTTQKEFNAWFSADTKKDNKDSRLQKVENTKVDGVDAVTLIDNGTAAQTNQNNSTIVTWFRKDGINYYISTNSNKQLTDTNHTMIKNILASFHSYRSNK